MRGRVLVVQPSLQPPGGGNAVAAWMVQALKDRHDVSVLTWRPIDLAPVNAYYGTSIAAREITALEVPAGLRRIVDALPTASVLLKASLTFRHAKRIADRYDVIVCGHNETDLGPRCIQYVHYPAYLRPRPGADLKWFHVPALLRPYYWLADRVARFSPEGVSKAVTLANSNWTAGLVRRLYGDGTDVRVVHPPVIESWAGRPWADRENGFVCIGRISPEKELERVIAIIARVRERVPDAHLHIIGSPGPRAYMRRILDLAGVHREWLHVHTEVSRAELLDLIGLHRYGIHGMPEEHFGIAPAEAVAGGCILFVPDGGGQVDIVGDAGVLRYTGENDAVEKISGVMRDPAAQTRLRAHLASRAPRFSTGRFVSTIAGLVDDVADPGRHA